MFSHANPALIVDFFCEVCGNECDDCICPECPECGQEGNRRCYVEHGMKLTARQIVSMQKMKERMRKNVIAVANRRSLLKP